MRSLILFALFLLPFVAVSQFAEDFSDGDFRTGPALWIGDTADHIVNGSNQLQLNAPMISDPMNAGLLFLK